MSLQNATSSLPRRTHDEDSGNENSVLFVRSETAMIFITVSLVIIGGILCLFGIVTNIINMIIFLKQGLDNTINISLFWLSVSDLCGLITLEWVSICNNPLVMDSDIPLDTSQIHYITGAWPHACFAHITCWITAYITAERCLCIALPLKVKNIITPKRTNIIIGCMYIINILTFIPECNFVYIDWQFNPARNKSLLTQIIKEDSGGVLQGLGFILFAVVGTISFPAVIIFTSILVVRLRHQAEWRQKKTKGQSQSELSMRREIRTMNMVVLVATILIVCYTPGILASITTFIFPGFSVMGSHFNIFLSVWAGIFNFEAFNSSVNIFLYYRMSTKYKNTFQEIFPLCVKVKGSFTDDK